MSHPSFRWSAVVILAAAALVTPMVTAAPAATAPSALIQALDESWLRNQPAPTLKYYADDAVVMQGGSQAWHGKAEIQAHWWPQDNPVTITAFKSTFQSQQESADLATLYSRFDVSFTMVTDGVSKPMTASGNYVTVLKRRADGTWIIVLQMWAHE